MTIPHGYKWGLEEGSRRTRHMLRPIGSPSWHVLNSIATVRSTTVRADNIGKRHWIASIAWVSGWRGQSKEGFMTLAAAKAWAESEMQNPATADSGVAA